VQCAFGGERALALGSKVLLLNSAGVFRPGRLRRVWNIMWKVDASLFYQISSALARLHAATKLAAEKMNLNRNGLVSEKTIAEVLPSLQSLADELDILGARLTAASVRRFEHELKSKKCTHGNLIELTSDIDRRLRDELQLVNLYALDEDKIKYFAPAQVLYDQDVVDKFPLAVTDIEDAGKCLSLLQGTASVFHSMRVMEIGLKSLAKLLDIPYAPSWESYLRQINDKISEKHKDKTLQWKADEAFFRDLSGDLQTTKIAWRNPTMHIVRQYTPDEAEEIFRAVRGFMKRLSARLPATECTP
jgi:hypothetical protein